MALVSLELRSGLVVAVVQRNGVQILTMTTTYKREPTVLVDMSAHFVDNSNHKLIPGIVSRLAVSRLTSRRFGDVVVPGGWRGPATVKLHPNAVVPIWLLPVVEPWEAFDWTAEFTAVLGPLLQDYLGEGSAAPSAESPAGGDGGIP